MSKIIGPGPNGGYLEKIKEYHDAEKNRQRNADLLAELKELDLDAWERYIKDSDQIRCNDGIISLETIGIVPSDEFLNAVLQSTIQNAIESRKWWTYSLEWNLAEYKHHATVKCVVNNGLRVIEKEAWGEDDCLEYIGTAALTLLSAYLKVLKEIVKTEKKK